jgi:hypothetical protein
MSQPVRQRSPEQQVSSVERSADAGGHSPNALQNLVDQTPRTGVSMNSGVLSSPSFASHHRISQDARPPAGGFTGSFGVMDQGFQPGLCGDTFGTSRYSQQPAQLPLSNFQAPTYNNHLSKPPAHGYTRIPNPPRKAGEYDAEEGLNKSWHHEPLPSVLTTTQWDIDFAEAIKNFKGDVDDKNLRARAHVHLISGKYGVNAQCPCGACVKASKTCRVYHPVLHTAPWKQVNNGKWLGHACSNCRLSCSPGGCKPE